MKWMGFGIMNATIIPDHHSPSPFSSIHELVEITIHFFHSFTGWQKASICSLVTRPSSFSSWFPRPLLHHHSLRSMGHSATPRPFHRIRPRQTSRPSLPSPHNSIYSLLCSRETTINIRSSRRCPNQTTPSQIEQDDCRPQGLHSIPANTRIVTEVRPGYNNIVANGKSKEKCIITIWYCTK